MDNLENYFKKEKEKNILEIQKTQEEALKESDGKNKNREEKLKFYEEFDSLERNLIYPVFNNAIDWIKETLLSKAFFKQQIKKNNYEGHWKSLSIVKGEKKIQMDIAADADKEIIGIYVCSNDEEVNRKAKALEEEIKDIKMITKEFLEEKIIGVYELVK